MSGNHFLRQTLFLLVETYFLASGNHFLPLPQIFFKKLFIPASGNTFFSPEEKVLFITQNFFPGNGKHYLNYTEAYLNILLLLLATIFFDFSDISANVSSFFVQQKSIPKQILHSCYWKPIYFLSFSAMKYIFWKITLFLLVETDFLASENHFFSSIFRH